MGVTLRPSFGHHCSFLPVAQLGNSQSLTTVIRSCSSTSTLVKPIMAKNFKIAIIGQSVFATEVYNLVRKNGHTVVGVFTIPDKNGREDPLAIAASADGVPIFKSICYHPSLLPRHRGASAISWTLIEGDTKGGFSIFYPDDGLDTGDLLLTRECNVSVNDTVDSK